jgi:sec-independent protein translocase protein TatA
MLAFLEGPELIIVLIIVLLVFGSSKVPQLARSLGEAQREFKKGLADNPTDDPPTSGQPPAPGSPPPPDKTPTSEPPSHPGSPPPSD